MWENPVKNIYIIIYMYISVFIYIILSILQSTQCTLLVTKLNTGKSIISVETNSKTFPRWQEQELKGETEHRQTFQCRTFHIFSRTQEYSLSYWCCN